MICRFGKTLSYTHRRNIKQASENVRKLMHSVSPRNYKHKSCTVCNYEDSKEFCNIGGYIWEICNGCSSLYVSNPPDTKDIELLYSSGDHVDMTNSIFNRDSEIYRIEEIMRPKYEFAKSFISTDKNSWLDVGCGPGEFLSIVKSDGWDVLGIDADLHNNKLAHENFDVTVLTDYFSSSTLERIDSRYGVISLLNILEHVYAPQEMLSMVSLLQSKGDNLIIEVPHFPCISAYIGMLFPDLIYRVITAPMHLHLFSIVGLVRMLEMINYRVRARWLFGNDFVDMLEVLGEVASNDYEVPDFINNRIINDVQRVLDENLIGDCMFVVAEKI